MMIENILVVLAIIISLLVFSIILITAGNGQKKEEKEKLFQFSKLKSKISDEDAAAWFNKTAKIRLYLSKNGAGDNVNLNTPEQYIVAKIITTLIGLVIGAMVLKNIFCIFGGILGFFIIDIAIKSCNKRDNDDMLRDLKNVYDTLRIQTKAGVFLSEALTDCYLVVSNKRLKKALFQLNKEIMLKHDVEYAIEQLSLQFNNIYIDNFVLIIQQSIQTGQSVTMLDNISEQMREAERRVNFIEKKHLEDKIGLVQILVWVGAIIMCVYSLFNYETLGNFNIFN